MLNSKLVIKNSNVAFGTSGARGLVVDFTPEVCAAFAHAFIDVMARDFTFDTVALAIDNLKNNQSFINAFVAKNQLYIKIHHYCFFKTKKSSILSLISDFNTLFSLFL